MGDHLKLTRPIFISRKQIEKKFENLVSIPIT